MMREKKIIIGILTADCVPILFYDPKTKIIGCAHAGWKGALNGIIENTIEKFSEMKSKVHAQGDPISNTARIQFYKVDSF